MRFKANIIIWLLITSGQLGKCQGRLDVCQQSIVGSHPAEVATAERT